MNLDLTRLKEAGFIEWQIAEMLQCQKNGISDDLIIKFFCTLDNPELLERQKRLQPDQINVIREGLIDGIDPTIYADYTIPAGTMTNIRKILNAQQGLHNEANDRFRLSQAKKTELSNKDHEKLHFSLAAMGIGMGALALVIAVLCIVILVLALKK